MCRTSCLNADAVFYLLAVNVYEHMFVTLIRLCTTAVLPTQTPDWRKENVHGIGERLSVLDRNMHEHRANDHRH